MISKPTMWDCLGKKLQRQLEKLFGDPIESTTSQGRWQCLLIGAILSALM